MNTELKTNKEYIVKSLSGCGYPSIFKMKVHEVTEKTYFISNLDGLPINKQRFTKEVFNDKFLILEEMDTPLIDNIIKDLKHPYQNNPKKNPYGDDYYNLKWTPFGPTID
jgi:hypothetical protein